MKKWLLTMLLVITCLFGLVGCGSSSASNEPAQLELTEEQRQQWFDSASQFVLTMNEAVQTGQAEAQMDDPVYGPAFSGWENSLKDIGEVQDITGKSCAFTKKDGTVTVTVKGSRHNADVVFTMESTDQGYAVTGIATNVEYSMKEKMQQAGLNTLLGMGTTFAILILLAFVISLFGTIMSGAIGGKKKAAKKQAAAAPAKKDDADKKAAETKAAVKNAAETTGEQPEDAELIAVLTAAATKAMEDGGQDGQLIAVLTAAVAAYEAENAGSKAYDGTPSADGFAARTIRKSRRK